MNWNDIRFFLAVARTLSLTEAAKELRVTQSTVARRITALEESLDANLFQRRSDGYQLTEHGHALVDSASEAEAHMRRIEREAAAPIDNMCGTVRVGLPELLGQQLLIPSFAEFLERYPDVRLEFIADVRSEKLTRRKDDVLLRLVQPSYGDYVVRRVGGIALGLYCARSYVTRHGLPQSGEELGAHRLIGWDHELAYLPQARWLDDKAPTSAVVIRTHSMGSQLSAANSGLGIAVLPGIVARQFGLVRVLPADPPFQADLWLLQHAQTLRSARVQAVADHLAAVIARNATDLEAPA